MKSMGIIRERGQLTIPESIRRVVSWVTPMSAVSISVIKPDEIVIKPYQPYIDWNKIWAGIRKSRSIKGRGGIVSSAKFLEKDRKSH